MAARPHRGPARAQKRRRPPSNGARSNPVKPLQRARGLWWRTGAALILADHLTDCGIRVSGPQDADRAAAAAARDLGAVEAVFRPHLLHQCHQEVGCVAAQPHRRVADVALRRARAARGWAPALGRGAGPGAQPGTAQQSRLGGGNGPAA